MKTGRWLLLGLSILILLSGCALAEENVFQPLDLPVIYLHIDGGQEEIDRMNGDDQHTYRCTGTMDIVIPDGYSGAFEGRYPQESLQGIKLDYIRGRGTGSWNMSKKPYKLKLEEKLNLFGMGKNKHWVLISNNFDNGLIRNWLTNWVGEQMGLEYTPDGLFVEVVMNGEYLGNYWFGEQLRTGKSRVAIDELTEADTALPIIQGGYLLEFRPDDEESPNTFETEQGESFGNMTPSFDPADGYVNDAQKNYIRDYIQRAEGAIWAEDGNYADFLDITSFADYWWIMEFSTNEDAYKTDSSHMFKKRFEADGSEGKLHFGPLWDFDAAWGNGEEETQQVIGFNHATLFSWANQLRTRPEYLELLKERWKVMDEVLARLVQEGGPMDQMAALLQDSWKRDDAKWRASREEEVQYTGRNLEEEIEHIRRWINLRREWINANLDRLGLLNFQMTFRCGDTDETYTFPCDTWTTLDDMEVPEVEGKTFVGWALEDGTLAGDRIWMDRDIILTAVFE